MKHPLAEAIKRKRSGLTIEISMGGKDKDDQSTDLAPEGSPKDESEESMAHEGVESLSSEKAEHGGQLPADEAKMHSEGYLKQALADKQLAGNSIPVEGEDAMQMEKEKVFGMKPDGRKPSNLKERMLSAMHNKRK